MDIKKLQKITDRWSINPELKKRIDKNELTINDVKFLENSISTQSLLSIQFMLDGMIPEATEYLMETIETKGKNHESIKLLNWFIDCMTNIKDQVEDIGLTEIVPVA
ncbi:hypothetical protein D3C81_173850 [compost metagenome]